jgi:hypothetical protein
MTGIVGQAILSPAGLLLPAARVVRPVRALYPEHRVLPVRGKRI